MPNPEEIEYASYITSKVTEKAIFGEGSSGSRRNGSTGGARYFKYSSTIAGAEFCRSLAIRSAR